MTLTEYLNQSEPVRMPAVYLEATEYVKHQTIKAGQDTLTLINIPAMWERFKIAGNYIQKNGGEILYTQDADGNAKSLSCFRIAEPKTLKEVTARMLQIEIANIAYNKATNFGNNPNGQEGEIEIMLEEWDILKVMRNKLKYV